MITTVLQEAIITQVCCGDMALCDAIRCELPVLAMTATPDTCTERLAYNYTLLAAIEFAQVWVRNKVDTETRTLAHKTTETYTARANKRMDAESTSQGKSCFWAAATSQQNFVRDSTDDTVAFHEVNYLRTAERTEDGFDLSTRNTTGSGFHLMHVLHTISDRAGEDLGPGLGTETRSSSRVSSTAGGTGPLEPLLGTTWDALAFSFSTSPPYIEVGVGGPVIDLRPPGDPCPEPDPDNGIPPCLRNIPSMGFGYHGKYRISIIVPGFNASLNLEWDTNSSKRQYYHCSTSSVTGSAVVKGINNAHNIGRTTATPDENTTVSKETTTIIHYVRKYGTSTRRGRETIDAEQVDRGFADGNAHSESERDSKTQSRQERRAESLTVSHSESHLRRNEHLTDDQIKRAYGQIAQHLAELWKRIWAATQLLERQLSAVPRGGGMKCLPPRPNCCAPAIGNLITGRSRW